MRKIFALLLSLITLTAFAAPAFADAETELKFVRDYRETLTEDDKIALNQSLNDIMEQYNYGGVIMISEEFSEITEADAMLYCTDQGLLDLSGCVAMVYSFNTNEICVYKFRDDLGVFSDDSIRSYFEIELGVEYNSYNNGVFSNEAMLNASSLFCYELEDMILQASNGSPVTTDYFTRAQDLNTNASYTGDAGHINQYEDTRTIPDERLVPRLVDEADLLTDDQEANILKKLDKISEEHEFDIIIVTKNSIGSKSSEAYADDYYDYNGCGFGSAHDGILFLISMENRDWAISTTGKGIPYFTDAGQAYIKDQFLPKLKSGDYNTAFNIFIDQSEQFIIQAENGDPYDYGNLPRSAFSLVSLGAAIVIALLIALGVCTYHKKQLLSVAFKKGAADYFRPGSFNLMEKNDIFLYKNVSKVRRESSSGGGHGGSSFHSGSSGVSHGGSHGHF